MRERERESQRERVRERGGERDRQTDRETQTENDFYLILILFFALHINNLFCPVHLSFD